MTSDFEFASNLELRISNFSSPLLFSHRGRRYYMNRIPIALFNERAKAEPIQRRLSQAGVAAEIHDELRLEKLWFVNKPDCGVRLEVPGDQFERAEQDRKSVV